MLWGRIVPDCACARCGCCPLADVAFVACLLGLCVRAVVWCALTLRALFVVWAWQGWRAMRVGERSRLSGWFVVLGLVAALRT